MLPAKFDSYTFFQPPRLAEERYPFWKPTGIRQPAVASALNGLGNDVSDVLSTLHANFIDLVGTVTGSKAQAQAQQNALELANLRAQQSDYAAQQRALGWGAVAPWLAVGGAVVVVAVVMSAARKS